MSNQLYNFVNKIGREIRMRHILSTAVFLLFAFVFVNVVPAQDGPKIIKGGLLNGKAISLPKPEYPEAAKLAKIGGAVQIMVVLDEEGNVESAEPSTEPVFVTRPDANGNPIKVEQTPPDPSLVEAARAAALLAKFAPTKLSGQPVKVSGIITYNFVPAADKIVNSDAKGGVLNGKALELPTAEYPAAAKTVRAMGVVNVRVLIDEDGNVSSASAVSGHPLLRKAAVDAASKAKFEPTKINGSPVKVSGVLTYNFVLPDERTN